MPQCPYCGHEQPPASPGTVAANRCAACGEWLGDLGPDTPTQTADFTSVPPITPLPTLSTAAPIDRHYDQPDALWDTDARPPLPPEVKSAPRPVLTPPVPPPPPPPPSFPEAEAFVAHDDGHADDAIDWSAVGIDIGGVSGRAVAVATMRRRGLPSFVYLLLTTMLIGIITLVILTQVNNGEERKPARPSKPAAADEPDESLIQQRNDLKARWDELAKVERNEQSATLLDQGTRQWASLLGYWERRDWPSANADLVAIAQTVESLTKVKRQIDEVARQRGLADELSKAVATARSAAERTGAPKLAAKLWADAVKADDAGRAKFDAAQYPESRETWDAALTAFEQANSLAAAGVAAGQTRKRIVDRTIERFTRQQLDELGGSDWKEVVGLLAKGDAAYEEADYSEAMANFEHAGDRIEAAELTVQREVGVKFYAVKAGYLAASILLEHAAGAYLDDAGRRTLIEGYRDLRLSDAFTAALPQPADEKLPYRKLAESLVTEARKAITDARGEAAQKAYNIGFQLRIIQKLLGEEGEDAIPETSRAEVGKSLVVLERDAKDAGFAEEVAAFSDSIRQLLPPNPTPSALGGARTRWLEFVGKMSRYDTAIALVGPTPK